MSRLIAHVSYVMGNCLIIRVGVGCAAWNAVPNV